MLEEKLNISKEPLKTVLSCNLCANSFDSKKNLKKHQMEKHPQKIKCKNCDGTFARNCDLELHMIAEHESEKYKCDKCEKTFILNWRFKKHQQSHSSETVKKCHYFNNNKECPYEKLGCMFDHVLAGACKFGIRCSNELCSFQHTDIQVDSQTTSEDDANKDKTKDVSENYDSDQHQFG